MLTQTIPTVAIAPLLVLWFGYDMAPKVVPIVVTTFFPIAVGLLGGFRSVDPNQIDLMRSMGASRLQIMRHVKLPAAMPQFFSGFKISAAYAVVGGAVFAEWLGGFSGLGVYVAQKKGFYKDAGLEVKIVQGPENGADSLVATGEGDFGVSFQDTMASYVVGADALPVTAIAAIIQVSRIGSMDYASAGSGYEMDAIAAVIVGGTSMSGGKGSIVGTVLGMLIIGVMNNLLTLFGVPPFLREACKGVIVIVAVLLQKKEADA